MSTEEQRPTDDERRDAAIRRLKAKNVFKQHVVSYLIINVFLVGIWLFTGRGYFWPVWTILPWGIGLAFHAWSIYGTTNRITEGAIRREMERGVD